MVIIVGLGNPGPKYENNRHNIGFMAVDAIHRRHGLGPWRRRFQGEIAEGEIAGVRLLLLKPMTFMNESGRSVGEVLRFYKAEPTDVVVLHDELDLEPGKLRVKLGGGAAGHNGLKSMIAHIGPHFTRIRLGIGHPGHRDLVHHHVLSDFAKADSVWLDSLLDAIAANADQLATDQHARFQNLVHMAVHPPKPKPARNVEPAPEKD
ncbi:PTH1 family peptidyl-tRNA hydrolase [Rhodoligotrophos appendicifer]|uniref:aminoacyl-tRNA hydrolase n=1 Tax=Rhodoligotrophos appendicifer TaxID=987056 RepID=UPI0011856D29|nr:aminoacyl-tRNA hydrolase [Rhodoligotrophos appendicifer]